MATIYVSTSGSWTAPYDTWAKAIRTLSAAMTYASSGDTIVLDYGVHNMPDPITTKNVTIRNRDLSSDYTKSTIKSTGQYGRFIVASDIAMIGVTIDGGEVSLAAFSVQNNTSGSERLIRLDSVAIKNHGYSGTANGGAFVTTPSTNKITIEISNSVVSNCKSALSGGFVAAYNNIFLDFSNLVIEDCFCGGYGGAIFTQDLNGVATINLSGIAIRRCKSVYDGSGACIGTSGNISDVIFEDCVSDYLSTNGYGSGSLAVFLLQDIATNNITVNIDGLTCRRNTCGDHRPGYTHDGAGLFAHGASPSSRAIVNASNYVAYENFAEQGPGLYVSRYADCYLTRGRIYNNIALQHGGGFFRGGQDSDCEGDLLVIRSTILHGNRAGYYRDGVTEYENKSDVYGGAGAIRVYPRVQIRHCSVINNSVCSGGRADAIANGVQRQGVEGMDTDVRRSSMTNTIIWNDDSVGNDVLVSDYLATGWVALDLDTNAYPLGQEFGSGVTPANSIFLTSSPVDENFVPHKLSLCIGSGFDDGTPTDVYGNALPGPLGWDIGAVGYKVQPENGFGPWTPFDATMPALSLSPTAPGSLLEVQEWRKANVTKRQIDKVSK